MKNNISILSLLILFIFSCNSSPKNYKYNCSKYKVGSFRYHVKKNQENFFFKISRNNFIQTEVEEKTGDIAKLRIKWIDDCNYELRLIESTFKFPDSILQLQKAEVLSTKILGGTSDYYLFESKSNILNNVLKDTMWIKK